MIQTGIVNRLRGTVRGIISDKVVSEDVVDADAGVIGAGCSSRSDR